MATGGERVGMEVAGDDRGGLTMPGVLWGLGPRLTLEMLWAVLRGKQRPLAEDAGRVFALLDPAPKIERVDLVPPREPFLLVANHLQMPRLWVGYVGLAITSAVARARAPGCKTLHWLVLSEWRWFEVWGHWVPNPVSALLFPRASKVWGLIPTPPRPSDIVGRARALRQILTYLGRRRHAPHAAPEPIAMFPEGTATIALAEAKPGTGAFLYHVSRKGVPLLPVGVYQEGGRLRIRFGEPFFLGEAQAEGDEERDARVREQVMVAIGRLLPAKLWGAYAEAIAAGQAAGNQPPSENAISSEM